jgi:mxaJ protein
MSSSTQFEAGRHVAAPVAGPSARIHAGTLSLMAALAIGLTACPAGAQDAAAAPAGSSGVEQKVLRVCQDPKNMPMSDDKERGFENRIAALLAKKMGWKLEHTFYPQRMGFIRNTLKAKIPDTETYKCDVVTAVSTDFDIGLATKPYLTSTYALAYVKGKGLDGVKTPDDLVKLPAAVRDKLRIGIYAKTPPSDWLLKNELIGQMVSYQTQTGDPEQYPGQIIDRDLASGKLDVAIAWGPIVGYFAQHANGVPIAVVPFPPEVGGVQYSFSIAMGVRYGEKALRDQLNAAIEASRPEIAAILQEYGVPMVAMPPMAGKPGAPS